MPLGLDDILFLVASTTALLYVKKHEIVHGSVYTTVQALTNDSLQAEEKAKRAVSNLKSNAFILRGFDLQMELRLELERAHKLNLSDGASSSLLSSSSNTREAGEGLNSLFRTSLVTSHLKDDLPIHEVPNVPHRHYSPKKRIPHPSSLASYTETEVAEQVGRYTVFEVHSVFLKMERERMWESVVRVSRGIEKAGSTLKYLTQANVEAGLRTLLECGKGYLAVAYYFSFGSDMLPSDDIVISLFNLTRNDDNVSKKLVDHLLTFQKLWSRTVYACCLTASARYSPESALSLYGDYMAVFHASQKHRFDIKGFLFKDSHALPALLPKRGRADDGGEKLQYLYHIIIPMVIERFPFRAEEFVQDMMKNDPDAAPEVFLRCLPFPHGRVFAASYLKGRLEQEKKNTYLDLFTLVEGLYALRPCAMNLNSVLSLIANTDRLLTYYDKLPMEAKEAAREDQRLLLEFKSVCESKRVYDFLSRSFAELEFGNTADLHILARTLTESNASWKLASVFLSAAIAKNQMSVVYMLSAHVARHGQWSLAAKSMSIYLSNQRTQMLVPEVSLCVESSIQSGKWANALFWIERAQSKRLKLSPEILDCALQASKYCLWEESLRVLTTTMSNTGTVCTKKGLLAVLEAAARQGKINSAVAALSKSGAIHWKP